MAGDDQNRSAISFAVPPDVDDWLVEIADRHDETREEACKRLLTATHTVATGDTDTAIDPDTIADLETQLADTREEFRELLEDVRSRVIQVKRETDAKAPADHGHDAYATVDDLDSSIEPVSTDLEAVTSDIDEVEARLEAGFDDYEEILEHLMDRTDRIEKRTTAVANVVADLREHQQSIAEHEHRRKLTDQLKLAANRLGARKASCEACKTSVDIALLTEPECPSCGKPVTDIEKRSSIFRSHTLVVDDPPALEEATDIDQSTTEFDWIASDSSVDSETESTESAPISPKDTQ